MNPSIKLKKNKACPLCAGAHTSDFEIEALVTRKAKKITFLEKNLETILKNNVPLTMQFVCMRWFNKKCIPHTSKKVTHCIKGSF